MADPGASPFDAVIVGGGIVGLSVGFALVQARPGARVVVLEKEAVLAAHQTGRNSGVLHSGVYYRPGSLKARTVAAGRGAMVAFCADHGVPYDRCGKVIVATDPGELGRLRELHARGLENGVEVEEIDSERLRELEPHVEGIAALHVPSAAIVDFRRVCAVLADEITAAGGEIRLSQLVTGIQETQREIVVFTTGDELRARCVVNCAGLHSDRVAALHGHDPSDVRIVPFRGEYFELLPERRHLVRNLVYPVPDPSFPFLGVHFTRMIDGGVHAGPNAVLALAREGYGWRTVDWADVRDAVTFRGLWRLAGHHWRTGAGEVYRSLSRRAFVRALQRLVPDVRASDLVRAPAGVRAQALDREGNLLDDFVIRGSARIVDVVNAPSPAATASLEIGRIIAASVVERLS